MSRLFYSYRDGEVYILHKRCPLELLMDEQAGDGLLIYASKELFEIIEYMDGKESGFTTRVKPKNQRTVERNHVRHGQGCDEFFECVSTVTGKKC